MAVFLFYLKIGLFEKNLVLNVLILRYPCELDRLFPGEDVKKKVASLWQPFFLLSYF